jgi:condensin complex subunit 1
MLSLDQTKDPVLKSNTVIALGDMAVCFSSIVDPYMSKVYERLHDPEPRVRKNSLMVLTHLVLNGMIKVRGQISEMARCLEDENTEIQEFAKLFFSELANKDNALYNNLSDVISGLSTKDTNLKEESFQRIMRYILNLLPKKVRSIPINPYICSCGL